MRVRAYTLVEVMVVMALSAIALAVAWMVYVQVERMALEYRKRSADSERWQALDGRLQRDCRMAGDVRLVDRGFELAVGGSADSLVLEYAVDSSGVVRKAGGVRDTFLVQVGRWSVVDSGGCQSLDLWLAEGAALHLHYVVKKASAALDSL